GALHVVVGNVEEGGDGVEVTVGLRGPGAPAGPCVQPSALQAGPAPCLPQCVAWIVIREPRGGADHRTDPLERSGLRGRQPYRSSVERIDQQVVEFPWLCAVFVALQTAAQSAQRYGIDPPDWAGYQRERALGGQSFGGGGQHCEQCLHRGV